MPIISLIIFPLLFFGSRLIIWFFPPDFTDIMYSYYHYARIWSEGYTPYLVHLFEYPPANIILFYLPWFLDRLCPIDYPTFYRFIIFLVDLLIFVLAIKTLNQLKLKPLVISIALFYYIVSLLKAKDFVYDSMDLVFISGLFLSLVLLKLKKPNLKTRFFSWFFFWLSTAFKYITFPLAIPFLLMKKGKELKEEYVVAFLSFLTVWGLPLAIFRTSLSVSLAYHSQRGFQVESVPANIIRLINSWTQSERYIEVFKNYDIRGPVTEKLTFLLSAMFVAAMLVFLIYAISRSLRLRNQSQKNEYQEKLRLSLIFLFSFLLTSKVFSTPFHLWLPPLLAVYPFKSVKKQLSVLLTSFFMIAISMTPIPNLEFSIFDLHTAIGVARPICLLFMLYNIIKT